MRHQNKFVIVVHVLKINAMWDTMMTMKISFVIKTKLVAMQDLLYNHTQVAHMVKCQANIDRFIG